MSGIPNRAGTKVAFNELLDAINALKEIENGRPVDEEDREILSKFCGFGAFATTAFPDPVTGEFRSNWESLGQELRGMLTEEEYRSVRATTFTAFYTSPVVMKEMHRGLARLGIEEGARGLEPGCGIGNFMGAAEAEFEFVGIEIDSISARIAGCLYPEHDIRIEGFQDSELPEGSVDFAIGNVPFADVKIRYQGGRHSLHDFFFLKSLDTVRPGGAIAFVTSRYTMDKASPAVRKLLAERADFVGAIRLPGEAFQGQGTSVVTDIIFLRRKPRALEAGEPEWADDTWLSASAAELGGGMATINDYFLANPHMVLGEMSVGQGMYSVQDLRVRSDGELAAALHAAVDGLPEGVCTSRTEPLPSLASPERDPDLPEYVVEGSFYVGEEQTIMQVTGGESEQVIQGDKPLKANGTPAGKRLGALIELKQRARHVLTTQKDGEPVEVREAARRRLRSSYSRFVNKFGPINRTKLSERQDGTVVRRMPNLLRFTSDPDVYLVMALEDYDERTDTARPAAIMEQDVVTPAESIESVESAKDGLVASLNTLGCVDISYISSLYGQSEIEVIRELEGLIFFDPDLDIYVPADEYQSGNVREKLRLAKESTDPRTEGNVRALEGVQPEDLVAEEIDVTLGTPWIPPEDVAFFLASTMGIARSSVKVEYVQKEALWKVTASSSYRTSAAASSEFGTPEVDAFTLAEQALNMRSPTVHKRVPGGPGEDDTYVVDQEATLAAREKQQELKNRFSEWAFEAPDRSERLVRFYNENFNNLRLREFDGSHLTFPRMSNAITMRDHQKAAIWRNMSSGNALLAHVVGAGKTFTMVASGMEMKRTGLAKKPLFVVPNHMLEQFSREFLVLYPDANILVATKRDLAKDRRQLFKARVATGNWDGIVMTHSSFEKIGMSPEFQARFLGAQIDEYEELLTGIENRSLSRNITKRVEKLKAARAEKVKEMANRDAKDGGLFFDELGVDQVFVDEAHMFKNLETPTKMDRVAGIQTGGSKRAFDLLMKARYLQSRTPGRGLTFATGTPVSNSLGEMYTMMRYLMPDLLRERGIEHFDAWAAAFGEVINALEISPDGQSLRVNCRFAKFKNLPELLTLFRLSADVQTGTMLKLPTPSLVGGKAEIVAAPMSEAQSWIQDGLVARYERVKAGGVDPAVDNALKIITDGRKLALDARLVDPAAEDDPESKINQLVDKVFEIWERTSRQRSTQMIFSDLGVSETDWGFCVYDDIMNKLEERGTPREEIANIGDANTDQKKEALFARVRGGQVRILLGSTAKMGTGTNVQAKLYALHHVDPPWRPADIEQREGRILRQGNTNREVEIYRYVTEGSFDAFMWQTLETKAKFISQAMAGDAGTRRADDIGGAELSFAEVKAIATGNPAMLVLAEMELGLRQLTLLRKAHYRDQAKIAAQVKILPEEIEFRTARIEELEKDIGRRRETKGDAFVMSVGDREFRKTRGEKKTARVRAQDALGMAVMSAAKVKGQAPWSEKLGEIGGLDIVLNATVSRLTKGRDLTLTIEGAGSYEVGSRITNTKDVKVQNLELVLASFDKRLAEHSAVKHRMVSELERYEGRLDVRFPSEELYQELVPLHKRLKVLLSKQQREEETGSEVSAGEEIAWIVEAYRKLSNEPAAAIAAAERTPQVDPVGTAGPAVDVGQADEGPAPAQAELVETATPAEAGVEVAPGVNIDVVDERPVEAPTQGGLDIPAAPDVAPEVPAAEVEGDELLVDVPAAAVKDSLDESPASVDVSLEDARRDLALEDLDRWRRYEDSLPPARETASRIADEVLEREGYSTGEAPAGRVESPMGEVTADVEDARDVPPANDGPAGETPPEREVSVEKGDERAVSDDDVRLELQPAKERPIDLLDDAGGSEAEDIETATAGSLVLDGTLAIVGQEDPGGVSWFSLAAKEGDAWVLRSMSSRRESGRASEGWVWEHATQADELAYLGEYLNADEVARLIPEQREVMASQARKTPSEAEVESPPSTGGELAPSEVEAVAPSEAAQASARAGERESQGNAAARPARRPRRDRGEHDGRHPAQRPTGSHRRRNPVPAAEPRRVAQGGQMRLFDSPAPPPPGSPPSPHASSAFSARSEQAGLFQDSRAEAVEHHAAPPLHSTRRVASTDTAQAKTFERTNRPNNSRATLFNQRRRYKMDEYKYNVIGKMLDKAQRWEEGLSASDHVAMVTNLSLYSGGGSPSGANAVSEVMAGRFHDDAAMQRVLLETLGRFGSFDEFLTDVRLRPGQVAMDEHTKKYARTQYNTALAIRVGMRAEGGQVVARNLEGVLREKALTWAASLPDYQAEDAAARSGDPVYPVDLEGIIEPHYSRPDILKTLIRQSVEDMRPFKDFLNELRNFGDLDHLDAPQAARVRRCYNALVAAGLDVDMQKEVGDRTLYRVDTVTSRSISGKLSGKYSQPDEIADILTEALEQGKSVGQFMADLRDAGELEPLTVAEMSELRLDYRALAIKGQRIGRTAVGSHETSAEERSEGPSGAPEPTEGAVVGQFTKKVGNRPARADRHHGSAEHGVGGAVLASGAAEQRSTTAESLGR